MDINEILAKCDHTLLAQTSTTEQIKTLIDDAIKFKTASVCIPPAYVSFARKYIDDNATDSGVRVCTVIGFPNGYNTTAAKVFETGEAVDNGADEIDMVINVGKLKEQDYDYVLSEIKAIKQACKGKLLKVIIETCLLNDDEKIKMCQIVTEAGAEYIKTSTGFSTGGATFDDIKLFSENIGAGVKMKAAGGISSLDDAEKFIELGASRLGTSRVVKLAKEL